jgi:SAM-dependent methyltransferase
MSKVICGMNVDIIFSDYVDGRATREGEAEINRLVADLTAKAVKYYGDRSGPFRERKHGNNYNDPELLRMYPEIRKFFDGINSKALRDKLARFDLLNPGILGLFDYVLRTRIWLLYMPTALALYAIVHPGWIRPGIADDGKARLVFDNLEVAQGIRARLDWLVRTMDDVIDRNKGIARITSLGCGEAYKELDTAFNRQCSMTLLDINPDALNTIYRSSAYPIIMENTLVASRNVLARDGLDTFMAKVLGAILAWKNPYLINFRSIGKESQDLVSAIGLAEYLPLDNWQKAIFPMAGLRQFLRNAYELVAPGGKLLVGFMLYDKWGEGGALNPHILFLTDVVQWGGLRPRSIDEVVTAFIKSGVDENSISEIKVAIMPEGLYALLEVTKERRRQVF